MATCFGTHHLMFAEDANRTLWTSGGGQVLGWLNTKVRDQTGDEEKAQGWTALILDFNGDGRRDEYVEPNAPADPAKDRRLATGGYGGGPNALAQRTPRELRPSQVPWEAQWSHRDRPALPGGMVLPRRASAAAQGRHQRGERRGGVTTPGSTSSIRSDSARTCRSTPGISPRGFSCSRMGNGSSCVSRTQWFLREVAGRPQRRSRGGVERSWFLGNGQHPRPLPYGRRQGHHEQGVSVPTPARSWRSRNLRQVRSPSE